ncbi:unnamed protein product [Ectocarpus sp. CCAP 1310/34]|nr:unnamed protein product [Ectocarpus sp. CCAP 1310/34]
MQVDGQRLGVEKLVEPPCPLLANKRGVPKDLAVLFLDVLRGERPLTFDVDHLQVPVETRVIPLAALLLELPYIALEERFQCSPPRDAALPPRRLEHRLQGRLEGAVL